MTTRAGTRIRSVDDESSVTPLELFFDLVFVYALTQVTALMAADASAAGIGKGMIVLALVWWCWVGYSWLGNVAQADEGAMRASFFVVMAAILVAALSIPESFNDLPGGLAAPVVFATCYAIVRLVHLGFFGLAAIGDRGLRNQLLRFAGVTVPSIALMFVGAFVGGSLQVWLWLTAVVVFDYAGTVAIGASGWRLPSAGHFSERHGLIIIIALGESIVAIGVGVTALPISWPIILASVLGIALAGTLWWAYFDVVAIVAERELKRRGGADRTRLARDSYTYLHLPMVAGIVLAALGMKKGLEYVGGAGGKDSTDALPGVPVVALHGGVALYLLAHIAFRLRNVGSLNRQRVATSGVLLALIPVGMVIPVLWDLAIVTAVMATLIAYEAVRFAEARDRVRHGMHSEDGADEGALADAVVRSD